MKSKYKAKIAAILFGLMLASLCDASSAFAQLRGHGGPVRAVAVSADGLHALSVSFDSSAILWSLTSNKAEAVLRFHAGAVNAVAFLADGRMVTAGEDARIALWRAAGSKPDNVLEGHTGPIVALAASPDGQWLASAAWDQTARLWSLRDGSTRVLEGHQQNVNGIAFLPEGKRVVTAGYDSTLRIWTIAQVGSPTVLAMPAPLNAVAVAGDGEIVTGAANGSVYFLSPSGERRGEVAGAGVPIIALAVSPDGRKIAAAGIRGSVSIIDRDSRSLAATLVGPGLPVWSATFLPDNTTLLTGGSDRMVRRWNVRSGEAIGAAALGQPDDPLAAFADDPGAQVFRACVACHTLSRDEGNRAGPSLDGIFGRRIATLPGYNFSPALKQLDIVWTPETLAKLFEIGPNAYTPGTKMPEQRITSTEDRNALVEFLKRATTRH
jgi:cytochrome c